MRQLPAYSVATANEDSSSEDEDHPAPRRRRKHIKSGMDKTGATTVTNKVTLPHEVVYTSASKLASYQDISVPQFVYEYLIVMDSEQVDIKAKMAAHLKDLMSDAPLYG